MCPERIASTSVSNFPTPASQRDLIERARAKAFLLYEGKVVPHRSCGIALAETFNLPSRPYQCLRKGGITGEGECGAIKAGELILGEYLGDPDPAGAVTADLRTAVQLYQEAWKARVDRGAGAKDSAPEVDTICNHLTSPFEDFMGPDRQAFCTNIAAEVAAIVAEILARFDVEFDVTPVNSS